MGDPYVELAKELKKRDNPAMQGITTGEVVKVPPDLTIVVNGIIASKEYGNIIVSDFLLSGYKRETTHTVEVANAVIGTSHEHSHTVTIPDETFTDTLKVGDIVIVLPSINNEIYYILGRAGVL